MATQNSLFNLRNHVKYLKTMSLESAQSTAEPLLHVTNLSQAYHHKTILKNLSFTLNRAEIVTILGRNGTGKTTLLKVLAGLLKPLRGQIKPSLDHTGMSLFLPDGFLYEDLSLMENLNLYAKLGGAALDWQQEMSERLGLHDFLNHPVRTLSRGQKIRGALCRTFLFDKSIYLLDEPFTGLDPTSIEKLVQLFRFLRTRGKTVLLSTHQMDSLWGVSDHWWQMENGQLLPLKNPEQLLEEWKNL